MHTVWYSLSIGSGSKQLRKALIMSGFYAKPCRVRGGAGAKCGRWNPTAEQVKVLSDLFRSGLRTPSSDQIEKISDQLSFYGEIESKNVFYWFQNHKARERQKRRRVCVGDEVVVHGQDRVSSPKQVNEGFEPTRVMETLQLFPVNTYEESEPEPEPEKMRLYVGEGKENQAYPYNSFYSFNAEMDHPPLDLRLSFL